jgi:hypothetical protein
MKPLPLDTLAQVEGARNALRPGKRLRKKAVAVKPLAKSAYNYREKESIISSSFFHNFLAQF